MKKNGFTLSELLATITVLAILTLIAVSSVSKYITDSTNKTNETMIKNLKDAAVSYALDKEHIANSCALTTRPTTLTPTMPSGCTRIVKTVQYLKDEGYFTDSSGKIKDNAQVLIYKFKENNHYNIEAYVPNDIFK